MNFVDLDRYVSCEFLILSNFWYNYKRSSIFRHPVFRYIYCCLVWVVPMEAQCAGGVSVSNGGVAINPHTAIN